MGVGARACGVQGNVTAARWKFLREINLILPPRPSFFSADNPGPFVSRQQLGIGNPTKRHKREKKRKKS